MAIVVGIAVLVLAFMIALFSEYARGMTTAPTMHASSFWGIFLLGGVLSAVIVASHWAHFPAW